MGGAQAAKVIAIVAKANMARAGITPDEKKLKQLQKQSEQIEQGLETISESMYCSARLMDDGLIDPRDTRKVISFVLNTCLEAHEKKTQETSFGVPRF